MKIAISATEPHTKAQTDPRFGRAKAFMIYDTETKSWGTVENSLQVNAPQGAGIQTAESLAKHNIDAVITGHCGPKAYRALNAAGIAVYVGAAGTVEDALSAYQNGELKPATGPDVEGHW